MANSDNDSSRNDSTVKHTQEESHVYEDEINLMDYFLVLWKRKWFIFFASVLPALLVALAIFLGPRDYTITYTYDVRDQSANQSANQFANPFANPSTMEVSSWNLNEKNYTILLSRFYSSENLSRIINRLQQAGFDKYAKSMSKARGKEQLEKLLKFEVSPPFIDMAEIKEMDVAKLEAIRSLEAQLLSLTITANSKEDIHEISSVITDNLETVIPVYLVAELLNLSAREFKARLAGIEENRFSFQLALGMANSTLAKLKEMDTETLNKTRSDIMLQFDVGDRSEYLPVEYQIQAAESKAIELEETLEDNENRYEYYQDLLGLNEKLLAEVQSKAMSGCTIRQFHSFLLDSAEEFEKEELKDYISSYTKNIENRSAVSKAVIENPSIYALPKGTVKKSGMVFLVALMLSVFAAFLLEGLK
jgi:hypothetical protein